MRDGASDRVQGFRRPYRVFGGPRTRRRARLSMMAVPILTLVPQAAETANTNVPRTPVIHVGETCIEVIDRSDTPIVHLDYTIPSHDTCVGPDEVEDSRTHQFLATCRVPDPWTPLPHWLDDEDVESSVAAGVLDEGEKPDAQDVFSSSTAWADCWTSITPDHARRPIDCASASEGVTWDTTDLPAGAWIVYGYTYQPPFNSWTRRAGVFKVVDAPAPAPIDDPPAVALHPHTPYAGDDAPLRLTACVDAPKGSILRASYAIAESETADWIELDARSIDVDGDVNLDLDLASRLDAIETVILRVEVEAPDGRRFAYVSPEEVVYVAGPAPEWTPRAPLDGCQSPQAFEPQVCPGQSEGGDPQSPACACRSEGRTNDIAWSIPLLLLGLRTRKHIPPERAP